MAQHERARPALVVVPLQCVLTWVPWLQLRKYYMLRSGEHAFCDHLDRLWGDSKLWFVAAAPESESDAEPEAGPEEEFAVEGQAPDAASGHGASRSHQHERPTHSAARRLQELAHTSARKAAPDVPKVSHHQGAASEQSTTASDAHAAASSTVNAARRISTESTAPQRSRQRRFAAATESAQVDSDKVVSLRTTLEGSADGQLLSGESSDGAASSSDVQEGSSALRVAAQRSDMMIVQIEPGGMHLVPTGATVKDIVQEFGLIEILDSDEPFKLLPSERVVNVNNELVPETTVLQPGDLVVLSNMVLENV